VSALTEVRRRDALQDGELVPAENAFDDVDAATGETLAEVARCGAKEVQLAVEAARRMFRDDWRRGTPSERAEVLQRVAALILRDQDELARLESRDTGKPISPARADVQIDARCFDSYARLIEDVYGDTLPLGSSVFAYTVREPHGVTGHITPPSYPAKMVGRTVAPPLEAGPPPGAFNGVPGLGEEAGAAHPAHPGIDHLIFTGSTEVGDGDGGGGVELPLGGRKPSGHGREKGLEGLLALTRTKTVAVDLG
jgi:aldehyde dehydrogenase (NAD+)/betaine-aldehyde dehydrogenase